MVPFQCLRSHLISSCFRNGKLTWRGTITCSRTQLVKKKKNTSYLKRGVPNMVGCSSDNCTGPFNKLNIERGPSAPPSSFSETSGVENIQWLGILFCVTGLRTSCRQRVPEPFETWFLSWVWAFQLHCPPESNYCLGGGAGGFMELSDSSIHFLKEEKNPTFH